jgi:hypothetical protein
MYAHIQNAMFPEVLKIRGVVSPRLGFVDEVVVRHKLLRRLL